MSDQQKHPMSILDEAEFYVPVFERDCTEAHEQKYDIAAGPFMPEIYPQPGGGIEHAQAIAKRFEGFGKCRIAKLVFID